MTAIVFFGAVQLIVLGILGELWDAFSRRRSSGHCFWWMKVLAGNCSLSLPPEFASLGPAARREIWAATRGGPARVMPIVPPSTMTAPFDVMSV